MGGDSHRGTRAIQRMVEFAPSTGGLALWVGHEDLPAGAAAPPVATDGTKLLYGRAFEELHVTLQAGLVAHEVLHIALRHVQRYVDLQSLLGDVDLQLYTICADAIVNGSLAHLSWLKLPPGSVTLEKLLKTALEVDAPLEQALLDWDVERLYRAIDDRRVARRGRPSSGLKQGGAGKDGKAGAGGATGGERSDGAPVKQGRVDGPRSARARGLGAGSLPDLVPGTDSRGGPEMEAERAREWTERLVRAHAGDGGHSMLRTLLADLARSRTPWEQVLRTVLARSLTLDFGPSWSRPSRSYIANQGRAAGGRRMPWEPGRSHMKPTARLVVVVDVSGSIGDELLERFAREIRAITRRQEAGLILVVGDDRVRTVRTCEPGECELDGVTFTGGGGTDFTPLLEEANRHGPDIGVVLTDLQGPAHFRPKWPVVWAVPEAHANAQEPFGRKLVLR